MNSNYWTTDGATTTNKLRADMEAAFGVAPDRCEQNGEYRTDCYYGNLQCTSGSDGWSSCYDGKDYAHFSTSGEVQIY